MEWKIIQGFHSKKKRVEAELRWDILFASKMLIRCEELAKRL